MPQILTQKMIGTAILLAAILGVGLTSMAIAAQAAPTKNQCEEAHARALANGNGNKYGLIKNQNCPPK